jgi:hypothetical protein
MHQNTFTVGGKTRFADVPWSERSDAAAAAAVRLMRAFLERHNYKGTVLWSTMSPAHFKGGDWNTGGRCVFRPRPTPRDERSESLARIARLPKRT